MGFPDILIPQIYIHIPDLPPGLCGSLPVLFAKPHYLLLGRSQGKQDNASDCYIPNENFGSCTKQDKTAKDTRNLEKQSVK